MVKVVTARDIWQDNIKNLHINNGLINKTDIFSKLLRKGLVKYWSPATLSTMHKETAILILSKGILGHDVSSPIRCKPKLSLCFNILALSGDTL